MKMLLAAVAALAVLSGCATKTLTAEQLRRRPVNVVYKPKLLTAESAERSGIVSALLAIDKDGGITQIVWDSKLSPELIEEAKTHYRPPKTVRVYEKCEAGKCTPLESYSEQVIAFAIDASSKLDQKAEPRFKQLQPPYPQLSEENGEEGKSKICMVVDKDGSSSSPFVEKSSRSKRLDVAAQKTTAEALKQVSPPFVPTKMGGKPAATVVCTTYNFILQ
ncbi:energy transducer TonB [Neisseria sp.]|uniref:energy transducer TonB n=1 Tax=Neisseria sp. TaxID=192066 RepID=UPI0026DBB337|nr:energy transducer TonB [Neisseria sp.]MDO4227611.1 energy transducer TonB [Neisseria sp.]